MFLSPFQNLFYNFAPKETTMRQTSLLLIVVALLAFGCQSVKVNKSLAEIDSLIVAELTDSAYQLVAAMSESDIDTPEDLAHFNLLRVQTAYLVNLPLASSDSILDRVIAYYEQHSDNEKLADAFYYHAIGAYKKGDSQQAILFYKKAELFANQSGSLRHLFKIAEGISFVNGRCANYDLQLKYAKQAWFISEFC